MRSWRLPARLEILTEYLRVTFAGAILLLNSCPQDLYWIPDQLEPVSGMGF